MVPLNTKVEDIQKLLGYLGKQIGWVEQARVEKALGPLDDRKVGAMVEFGLILRDGSNLRPTERGTLFNTDPQGALREVLKDVDLYRATLEWVHYGSKSEVTVAEIGQYWESSHVDTIGDRRGSTLREGAVCFGRIVEGAAAGSFTIGRGGKETRVTFASSEVDALVNGAPPEFAGEPSESEAEEGFTAEPQTASPVAAQPTATQTLHAPMPSPSVSVSTSPSVHVNVEIHIAADATADTVREIFKNMARYVLDKPIADDGD
ncbi:hypothetical protein [Microbacterium enclense]|uniref:hypothetical protein n=1 Tax=Microbacterium enclense TaxID=993073 RepID=UPI003F7F0C5A